MNITVSEDDAAVDKAQKRAEELGATVDQLRREFLEQLVEPSDPQSDADEFASRASQPAIRRVGSSTAKKSFSGGNGKGLLRHK